MSHDLTAAAQQQQADQLDQRIAAVLTYGSDTSSATLAALISETEWAAAKSKEAYSSEKKRSTDPAILVDADKSRAKLQQIECEYTRLQNALVELRKRMHGADKRERVEKLKPRHAAALAKSNALNKTLHALYVPFLTSVVPLLHEIEASNKELRTLNADILQAGIYDDLHFVDLFPERIPV